MRFTSALSAGLLLAAAAAPAAADPAPTGPVRSTAGRVCLDTLDMRHAPSCRSTNASRILTEPDICVCPAGLREVAAPFCAPGERPAPDSARADSARLRAAKANGTLVGAGFEGRSFCVTRGRTGESG